MNSYADLAGKVIGGHLGFVYAAEFNQAVEAGVFTREDVQTADQNYRKLLSDRIHGFVHTDISLLYDQQQNPQYAGLALSPLIIAQNNIHMAMRKDNPLTARVFEALDELLAEGVIQEIVASYR